MALEALEGAIVGGLCGASCESWVASQDGPPFGVIGGFTVGIMYGAVTGWALHRMRWWFDSKHWIWLGRAATGLLGVALTGASAAALAYVGDTHEFWSPPLPLIAVPYFLCLSAYLAEAAGMGTERLCRADRPPKSIDLADVVTYQGSALDTFWFLTLLLSLRDRATEIRLAPDPDGYKLCYRVNNSWRDLVAPPTAAIPEAVDRIDALALPEPGRSRLDVWMRRVAFVPTRLVREGTLPLRFGRTTLTASVSIQPTPRGKAVMLRLPDHALATDRISSILRNILAPSDLVPQTGIHHVYQGKGNCAIATLAMIGGITYSEAEAGLPNFPAPRKGWVKAYLTALERFTGEPWESVPLSALPRRLDQIGFPDWPVIVVICPRWRWRRGHCIAIKGRFVHDPNRTGAVPMDRYFRRDWRVWLVLQPKDP